MYFQPTWTDVELKCVNRLGKRVALTCWSVLESNEEYIKPRYFELLEWKEDFPMEGYVCASEILNLESV